MNWKKVTVIFAWTLFLPAAWFVAGYQMIVLTDRSVAKGEHAWELFYPVFLTLLTIGKYLDSVAKTHPLWCAFGGSILILVMVLIFVIKHPGNRPNWKRVLFFTVSVLCGVWGEFISIADVSTSRLPELLIGFSFMAMIFAVAGVRSKSVSDPCRYHPWILTAIIILAFMFRFYHIDILPAGQAQHTAEWGMIGARLANETPFSLENSETRKSTCRILHRWFAEEPHQIGGNIVFDWILASVYKPSLIAQRVLSGWVGVLSVWIIYLTGNILFGPVAGYSAAFLAAVSPWHIMHSRYSSLEHIIAILFTSLTVFLVMKVFKKKSILVMSLLTLVLIADFYLYVTAQLIVPVIFIMWLRQIIMDRNNRLKLVIGCILVIFFTSLGIAPKTGIYGQKENVKWLNTQISEHPSYEVQEGTRLLNNAENVFNGLFLNGKGEAWFDKAHGYLLWPVSLFLLMGIAILLTRLNTLEHCFVLLWFCVGIMVTIPAPVVAPRRILCALPAIFIIAGLCLSEFHQFIKPKRKYLIIGAGICLIYLAGAWHGFAVNSEAREVKSNGLERRLAEIVCNTIKTHKVIILAESHTRLEKIWLQCSDSKPDEASLYAVEFIDNSEQLNTKLEEIISETRNRCRLMVLMYANEGVDMYLEVIRGYFPDGKVQEFRYDPDFVDHSTGEIRFLGWVQE